jgi:uncharacterized damage-inducible protein DinB
MTNLDQVMARLTKTAEEFSAAIEGVSESVLSRRPNEKDWAAKEIVCHLRDAEESFMQRFQIILSMNGPKFPPSEPDRLAVERQYLRNDVLEALSAFRKRREETLKFLRGLKPEQWERAGIHPTRGPMTIKDYVELMANHGQIHLEQLKRALAGQP